MEERLRYWLLEIFERAEKDEWYGELHFGVRKGVITRLRREEVELPPGGSQNGSAVAARDEAKV